MGQGVSGSPGTPCYFLSPIILDRAKDLEENRICRCAQNDLIDHKGLDSNAFAMLTVKDGKFALLE